MSAPTNGNGTTAKATDLMRRCLPLSTGALSPDLRVNYSFGLVLGETEFRQEQLYFLERDQRHHRALHGYGTAYGLKVEIAPQTDDALITVTPGLGIDQWGRPVIVRDDQCAKLMAWLTAQERRTPGIVDRYRGASGDLHIYVVAQYDECEDALVPIAGEPCAQLDDLQAASRIRDARLIELRFEPPAMRAWDMARKLADLLAQIHVEPGLPAGLSDFGVLLDLVRNLDARSLTPGQVYRLTAETARQDLDHLFVAWATEVRPRVEPHLIDVDASEAGILLARIDFVVDGPANDLVLVHVETPPDDTDRPFLLPTQVIQELPKLGGDATARPLQEFATLHVHDQATLFAWIHYPAVIADLTSALTVLAVGQSIGIQYITPMPGLSNLFQIGLTGNVLINPDDRIEVDFDLQQVILAGGGTVLADLDSRSFDYVSRQQNMVAAYTIADHLPPTRAFVSFKTIRPTNEQPFLELWFHTDAPIRLPDAVQAQRFRDNATLSFRTTPLTPNGVPAPAGSLAQLWRLTLLSNTTLGDGDRLAFRFDTDVIVTGPPPARLTQRVRASRLAFLGYDGDHLIDVFYQVEVPPIPTQTGITLEEVRKFVIEMPTLPFVTINVNLPPNTDSLICELWFHPTLDPTANDVEIDKPVFDVFAERGDDTLPALPIVPTSLTRRQRNVFTIQIEAERWKSLSDESPYLRFVFDTTTNNVNNTASGTISLENYIAKNNPAPIKFEGHTGGKLIVAYARVVRGRLG
jgi:hypothetical protein